jgi:hypothetical protein
VGDARRKRLMAKKKDRSYEAQLTQSNAGILEMRREYDTLVRPWRKHLEEFATQVGPSIFPKDDPNVCRFLIKRIQRMGALGLRGDNVVHLNEDDVSVLAALLDPFIKQKPRVIEDGLRLLQASVLSDIERAGVDEVLAAVPSRQRDVSLILGAIYAERMLKKGRTPEEYVPFEEIDFDKHMRGADSAAVARVAIESYMLAEESLKGDAAIARDAFNALVPEEQERLNAMARSVDKRARDHIVLILKDGGADAQALQKVFEASVETIAEQNTDIGNEAAGLFSFAVAKLILQEMTENARPVTLLQMESVLTGDARIARMTYNALEESEKNDVNTYLDKSGGVELVSVEGMVGISALQTMFDKCYRGCRDGAIDLKAFVTYNAATAIDWTLILAYALAKKAVRLAIEHDVQKQISEVLGPLPKNEQQAVIRRMEDMFKADQLRNSQTKIWDDMQLTQVGVALWEKTYKLGDGDTEAAFVARKIAEQWARDQGTVPETRLRIYEDITCFAAKWAVHAFQRITTTHTYAAALMCSDADKAVLSDIELQWSAFMVCIPNGLLSYVDEKGIKHEYNRILVGAYDKSASLILINQHGDWSQPNILSHYGNNIADVLTVTEDYDDGNIIIDDSVKDKIQRITTLARRLVAGLLLALQTKENFESKTHGGKSAKKGRLHAEPAHRVVFVGGALKVDCRPAVATFIAKGRSNRGHGPHAAPSFQTLVRGHFRRQVCGTGRRDRKVIFIQPFWKGDENLPILTRPKRVSI